jgi:hypothetical protein
MSGGGDGFGDLPLAAGSAECGPAEEVLGDIDLVVGGWLVALQLLGQLVGVVEDFLHRSGHLGHLRYLGRAVMAWTMNSMPSSEVASSPRVHRPGPIVAV